MLLLHLFYYSASAKILQENGRGIHLIELKFNMPLHTKQIISIPACQSLEKLPQKYNKPRLTAITKALWTASNY